MTIKIATTLTTTTSTTIGSNITATTNTNEKRPKPPPTTATTPGEHKKLVILAGSYSKRLDMPTFCNKVPINQVYCAVRYTAEGTSRALDTLKNTTMDMLVIASGENDVENFGMEVLKWIKHCVLIYSAMMWT